ncbi:hypothetical protein [Leifsonia sp. NPDC058230]|uniref:hypothetical protein n=1 Tax=Leifsonia sp. NPDC058230 TaxID=3346391 RepID=UPI0036DB39FC
MTDRSVPSSDDFEQVPPSVRAQLLATEHWSLLASRSTTQAEVLTRISIFLTLTSAGLVSLALAGQAMDFGGMFPVLAMIVLAIVLAIGILTQIRVFNVGFEDLAYVLAMNRLRAAYAELYPGIRPYLMTSPFDDRMGSQHTYVMLGRRSGPGHFAGSSMMLITVVNAVLVGVFVAGIVASLTFPPTAALVTGLVGGALYLVIVLVAMDRRFQREWAGYEPRFPSPPADDSPR